MQAGWPSGQRGMAALGSLDPDAPEPKMLGREPHLRAAVAAGKHPIVFRHKSKTGPITLMSSADVVSMSAHAAGHRGLSDHLHGRGGNNGTWSFDTCDGAGGVSPVAIWFHEYAITGDKTDKLTGTGSRRAPPPDTQNGGSHRPAVTTKLEPDKSSGILCQYEGCRVEGKLKPSADDPRFQLHGKQISIYWNASQQMHTLCLAKSLREKKEAAAAAAASGEPAPKKKKKRKWAR
jgi:hypothetical protein